MCTLSQSESGRTRGPGMRQGQPKASPLDEGTWTRKGMTIENTHLLFLCTAHAIYQQIGGMGVDMGVAKRKQAPPETLLHYQGREIDEREGNDARASRDKIRWNVKKYQSLRQVPNLIMHDARGLASLLSAKCLCFQPLSDEHHNRGLILKSSLIPGPKST